MNDCWSLLESSGRTGSRSPAVATASPSTTFRSPRLYQEEVASASPPALPQLLPHIGPSAVRLFYSTPPQGTGMWPMKEASHAQENNTWVLLA